MVKYSIREATEDIGTYITQIFLPVILATAEVLYVVPKKSQIALILVKLGQIIGGILRLRECDLGERFKSSRNFNWENVKLKDRIYPLHLELTGISNLKTEYSPAAFCETISLGSELAKCVMKLRNFDTRDESF